MSTETRHNYIYVPFRAGDKVRCTRHYEKEEPYKALQSGRHPVFGSIYVVSEVCIGYDGSVWIGLAGVGRGLAGWSATSFEEVKKAKKKKEEKEKGRMIRI
jgi:hypothetical protein